MFDLSTKILVVDDMMTMRKLVKRSLTTIGFTDIEEAEDGEKAWQKLQESGEFKLIISDWNMPNCTGIELLKRVRADAHYKNLPFILLTAEAEAQQIQQAVSLRVSSYIVKPFNHETIVERLEQTYKRIYGGA